MFTRIFSTLVLLALPLYLQISAVEKLCDFLPENDLYIGPEIKFAGGMTETEFNQVIDRVSGVYSTIVQKYGGRLTVKRLWNDGKVNASAIREGSNYIVEMYGGMARHASMTVDAFALVLCHEIGHHIGGAPKYTGRWAATEGQSDYFATMKCFRRVFTSDNELVGSPDRTAYVECEKRHGKDNKEMRVCLRMSMAGIALGKVLAEISNGAVPRLEIKDTSVVSKTYEGHPRPQCRLDTYFQGSLCAVPFSIDFNEKNVNQGACVNRTENDYGARPLCWYKPESSNSPQPTPPATPAPQPDPNPSPDGIAKNPTLNGSSSLNLTNPQAIVSISWDVRDFINAAGVYIEFSKPNLKFSNPNDVNPDPQALGGISVAQVMGQYKILPAKNLPGWGRYEVRVVPLDRTGRRAVGRASNSSILSLQKQLQFY